MKVAPKLSLRPFLHRALQIFTLAKISPCLAGFFCRVNGAFVSKILWQQK